MSKFNLATSKNIKVSLFNLAVSLRKADYAIKNAINAIETISREGNSRDVDSAEIENALNIVSNASGFLQYINSISYSLRSELETFSTSHNMSENFSPPGKNRLASLDSEADKFLKLCK